MAPSKSNLNSFHWDAHGCPPFGINADLSFLERYKNSGLDFVSLNIGFDLTDQIQALKLINHFHQWVKKNNNEYGILEKINELSENKKINKLSIAFDIEGCNLLNRKISLIKDFYSLGVKQLTFAYNLNNAYGGGCFDLDIGLTPIGKELLKECNNTGMIIDCSHVSYQTSMEIIDSSEHPVIFSHSNPEKLKKHPRNIKDDQIIACARKGGVIGINGIGIFLGENDTSSERIVDHIDYVAEIVGSEHVGLGLDCIFSPEEIQKFVQNNQRAFPPQYGFTSPISVAQPEQFSEIAPILRKRGYSQLDINNILGANFFRVATQVWK